MAEERGRGVQEECCSFALPAVGRFGRDIDVSEEPSESRSAQDPPAHTSFDGVGTGEGPEAIGSGHVYEAARRRRTPSPDIHSPQV
jgi:hypothetical protein